MNKQYQLVVFDWDGTLMDSEHRIVSCAENAIADLGLEPLERESIRNIIGLGLSEAVEALFPGKGTSFQDEFIAAYRSHYLGKESTPSPLFEGAAAVVRELQESGYLLAVATGKGRPGLERVLDETGLRELFVVTRCADDAFSKPHPQMLEQVMDYAGCSVEETLMVWDTEYDMQMARDAGADALAVSYGVHEVKRLMQHNPVGCVDDIREVPQWLTSAASKSDCTGS